jgi:uncharacterized protein (TIGR03437 family)
MYIARVGFAIIFVSTASIAQRYQISTFAGGSPPQTPISGLTATIDPGRLGTDARGNVFFTSTHVILKLDQTGVLNRIAGNSRMAYSGDGGPAINAELWNPAGVVSDREGNLYVADSGNNRVRKISTSGIITTVAQLSAPQGLAIDGAGNLFTIEHNSVRKISPAGTITTAVGTGTGGFSGDGGSALDAQLQAPTDIAIDAAGNLYIGDSGNHRVRKVSPNGTITTVAGNGIQGGSSGDGGPAVNATIDGPLLLTVDGAANLYITDFNNRRIRRVASSGVITTFAGTGTPGVSGDGGQATAATMDPWGLAFDATGNLYVADYGRIRKISPNGVITTVAGTGRLYGGDGGPATSAQLHQPSAVAVDGSGNVYIADDNPVIRKVATNGIITSVAGTGTSGYSGDGGPATNAQIRGSAGLAADNAGNVFLAATFENRVRKVSPAGIITNFAGNGTQGYSGDGGPATSAQLNYPSILGVDRTGNLYISDNGRIRRITPAGTITTIAGNGTSGYSGDDGPAISAQFNGPLGIALDSNGNLFVSDSRNHRIRKIAPNGIVTTFAGTGSFGYSGDGGPAANAFFAFPAGMAIDNAGNLYVADTANDRIRKIDPSGIITTVGGIGYGYSGDGGPALSATLGYPEGLAIDSSGNLYDAEHDGFAVRVLKPVTGPALAIGSVTNGASNLAGPVSQGEIIVIKGSGLGPAQITEATVGDTGIFGTGLAGTAVSVNGIAAPMIYTSAAQVASVFPYGINSNTAQVTVTYQGQTTDVFPVPVASSAPGIFTLDGSGQGQAAAVNQDNSLNTAGTPAKFGDVIVLFATGEGQTTPSGMDGKPATVPLPKPNLTVSVTIGGQPAQLQYFGGAPAEIAGLMQINAVIPYGIQTGNSVPVVLKVGDVSSQPGVTVAIR